MSTIEKFLERARFALADAYLEAFPGMSCEGVLGIADKHLSSTGIIAAEVLADNQRQVGISVAASFIEHGGAERLLRRDLYQSKQLRHLTLGDLHEAIDMAAAIAEDPF